jgi:2-methylisocitrate lyase-like PEP mutase family enzyme
MNESEQKKRAQAFAAMHEGDDILVLPNAWDAISACVLVDAGFAAVATTSGGCAFALGYCDGEKTPLREMAGAVRNIANAVPVPVSADMEAGYGPSPEDVAETTRQTLEAGAVGINIEDSDKRNPGHLFDFEVSVERIRAARAVADTAGIPMVINARTDGFHHGNDDEIFAETVRRANAYLQAGAGCAFVPFVSDGALIGRLAAAIDGPMNVLAGPNTPPVPMLHEMGVKRVTVGGNFTKAAMTLVRRAAEELRDQGTFEFAREVYTQGDMHRILTSPGGRDKE